MKRSLKFATLTLALAFAASAHAQDLPSYDKSLEAPAVAPPASASSLAAHGAVSSWDTQRGVPAFFWADAQVAASVLASVKGTSPEDRAWAYVKDNAALYGLGPAALSAAYVKHVHDTGRGAIIVVYGQKVDGIEVHRQEMKVVMDRSGLLVAIGGNLSRAAAPTGKGTKQAFSTGAAPAIAAALTDLYNLPTSDSDLLDTKQEKDGYRFFDLSTFSAVAGKGVRFSTPARAKKVFFSMPGGLVPAYYLEIFAGQASSTSARMWGYVVDARTGEVLLRHSLTSDAAFKYKVWADAAAPYTPAGGPQADFTPHPTGIPDGSSPAFVAPTLITMDGFNAAPGGGSDPWLDANAMQSTGNNVDAYADLAQPDGFSGSDVRATPTGALTFDRTYDTTLAPASSNGQIQAGVTQLFYTTNWQHDYWYDSGFNEAAGNAQTNNYGRGGAQGDPLHVEAQDYSGTDNANMNTPADGQSPVMQMYIWDAAPITSTLNVQPGNLNLTRQGAGFGPGMFNVTAQLVLVNDGNNPVTDACQAIQNNIAGKIALLDRGNCTFESKVLRAQQAGAVGVLLANNVAAGLPNMSDDPATNGVTIGSFGISQADGNTLKAALLNGTVTVTMAYQAGPTRAGELDGDIVSHEWGHYIHHRLVACGTTQCGAESEGWGDFLASITRIHSDDNVATGTFGLGIYATAALGDSGYFGVRRFPYTRDMTKNGLTFKHITNNVALPAGPQAAVGGTNFEVHNAGEVWNSMMFQAYTNLLLNGGHTFTEAKRRMADYVVAGMKAAPTDPTFTEQRDGILAAAAANDANDFVLLAEGFADRGAGTCAVSPARNSNNGNGVVEDFNLSGKQELAGVTADDSVKSCDSDGILDQAEIGKLKVSVRNSGAAALAGTQVTVTTNTPGVTFPNGNSATIQSIAPFALGTASLDVALDAAVATITDADFTITIDNAATCTPSVQDSATVRMNIDDTPNSGTTEDVESANAPWTHWGAPGYESLADAVWSREYAGNGNYRFHGIDYSTHSDTALVSPPLAVGSSPFVVTFQHAFDFESSPQQQGQPDTRWDGGLIEITSDGGATWQDVSMFAMPGYNGTIANVQGADNPLANRAAYIGRIAGWPAMSTVTLNFGTAFTNKMVQIRFRMGTDAAGGDPDYQGWLIDNLVADGITNKPFHTV
ncbi:MAG: M36 family metallopeptidase, partial [Polyangiaceae bacterium]